MDIVDNASISVLEFEVFSINAWLSRLTGVLAFAGFMISPASYAERSLDAATDGISGAGDADTALFVFGFKLGDADWLDEESVSFRGGFLCVCTVDEHFFEVM